MRYSLIFFLLIAVCANGQSRFTTPVVMAGYSGYTLIMSHHSQSIGAEYVTKTNTLYSGPALRLGIQF